LATFISPESVFVQIRRHCCLKQPEALDYKLAISQVSPEASKELSILPLFKNTGNLAALTDRCPEPVAKTVGQPAKNVALQNWNTNRP